MALVQANTGKAVALYDYDPFGGVVKAIGDFASQNPFRYSNQYMDSETGLLYYGLRFYNPATGRWINRDPNEEAGGFNLYEFASNDGIGRIDLLGLSDYSSIAKGDLIYSCNCGWIDWRHADPVPWDPYSTGQLWKSIYNESGFRDTHGLGFFVQYGQSYQIPYIPRRITPVLYYSGEYYVKYGLSWNQKVLVALSIVKEVSEGFEHFQRLGGGNSSFSEEDLVSDLLALNMAIFGYDQGAIGKFCYALDIPKSQHIYKENYGEGGSMRKSHSWLPTYYDVKECQYCDKAPKAWPYDRLYQMQTIPKGLAWGEWLSVE